jgi:hypothetical protein
MMREMWVFTVFSDNPSSAPARFHWDPSITMPHPKSANSYLEKVERFQRALAVLVDFGKRGGVRKPITARRPGVCPSRGKWDEKVDSKGREIV